MVMDSPIFLLRSPYLGYQLHASILSQYMFSPKPRVHIPHHSDTILLKKIVRSCLVSEIIINALRNRTSDPITLLFCWYFYFISRYYQAPSNTPPCFIVPNILTMASKLGTPLMGAELVSIPRMSYQSTTNFPHWVSNDSAHYHVRNNN